MSKTKNKTTRLIVAASEVIVEALDQGSIGGKIATLAELAVGLMLEHIEQPDLANRLRAAIDQVLRKDGVRTPDLGGKASTGDFTQSIIRRLGG